MDKLLRISLLLLALTAICMVWFLAVEGWSLIDAFYMAVITLTTVGFSEVRPPLEPRTKLFLAFYLVACGGIYMYAIVELAGLLIRAELRVWWRARNMEQERKALKNHFIVCGVGRMGQMLCRHLADAGMSFIAIDREVEAIEACRRHGWPALQGDATEDRTLLDAGVQRARGLATVLTSDADNLYVVLSAKLLARQVHVVARAFDDKGVEKMQKAGADQVVSLYASGATKMAHLLTNPKLGDFFEIVAADGLTMDMAEIEVTAGSPFAHQSLAETDFRRRGILIVGIRQASGKVLLPPVGTTVIEPGDYLFALGDARAIATFTNGTES